ncbi:M20 family peptidase [Aquincola sp. S2]|uniref:M20 family peptidase n=1 Tax=Pseudaquabacterium terrae TaxID=2732868 RepID=A0ABX2EPD9_9BURK|nr:M20 family peptidase [Aquabacterium terrae]NRF70406.1 M20 family peptidase [Aquabacterium terrae]
MRRLLQLGLLLAGGLVLVLLLRTALLPSRQVAVVPLPPLAIDTAAAAERLGGAVRIRTVSIDGQPGASGDAFIELHAHLERSFPLVHQALKREVVNRHSLLYTWTGSDPRQAPILLMAHQDVVPIAPGTEGDWQQPPFSGALADGHVWGRGAWDDKGNLMAMLEAVERLVAAGVRPRRTVVFALGHDEEMGSGAGRDGAAAIAALLRSRGQRFAYALDEGLLVTEGVMAGLEAPVALIGVAEKGYLTLELTAHAHDGHSSMPPQRTAIGSLAAALDALQQTPMPADLDGVARGMFDALAPEFSGPNRLLLSNLWLFGPLVQRQLQRLPSANAMLRTTIAPVSLRAGAKDNTLPAHAGARINLRLLPGDTPDAALDHVQRAVDPHGVRAAATPGGWAGSRVSRHDSAGYRQIERTVREVFPGALVAPGLMVGATDTRHYAGLVDDIYRFTPLRTRPEDLPRFHGTNERIAVDGYADMIRFYHRLLSQA